MKLFTIIVIGCLYVMIFIGINRLRCVKEATDVTLKGTVVILVPFCVIRDTNSGHLGVWDSLGALLNDNLPKNG